MTNAADPQREPPAHDQRREKRVADTRIALVRFADEECLGTIENVSLNGVRVALFTQTFPQEADIVVDGAYEDDWVTFVGRVRYVATHAGGWTVGVQCDEDARRKDFVTTRYQI